MQAVATTGASILRDVRSRDWLTFVLATAAVVAVIRSVEAADWVATPPLWLMTILGALLGFLVSGMSGKAWKGHLAASFAGAGFAYVQAAGLAESDGIWASMGEVNSRLGAWWGAVVGNELSTEPLPFAIILSALAWTAGYTTTWAVFRLRNVWVAIIPSALGLFVNLTYLPEGYFVYLFPFLLLAMLLMMRVNSLQLVSTLDRKGIGYPRSLRVIWMASAVLFSTLVVGSVFLLPANNARLEGLTRVWNASRSPAEWVQQQFGRLFSSVGSKKTALTQRFAPTFPILPILPAGDDAIFRADLRFPVFWSVRAYNNYSSGGWTSDDTISQVALNDPTEAESFLTAMLVDDADTEANEYAYYVETDSHTPYVFAPSMPPYTLNVPAKVETHEDAPYLVDIVAIRPDKRLGPGDRYTGTFLASSPSENALRAADQVYPDWVTERYLTLSDSVPGRIKRLAADITGGATNPYDQARAIEDYLRTFEYGSSPSQPGSNQDRVDHFLFDTQTGHSDHFASAMAVMLRAEGIPSRLVSGFGPGDYDLEAQEFVISGRDLHSWPEAFFPGLGWVEFEPSPIYPLRPRAQEDLLAFGLGGTRLSLDGLPADGADGTLPSEEDNFVEVDPGGGRLPGGEGARPLPLFRIPTPMSTGGALLGVTTATWLLVLWLVWRRFFATLPGPEHAFSRLQRMARLLQVRPRPGQTPLEFGSTLAAAVPQAGADIALICQTYGGALYGEAELQDSDRGMLTAAWHRVRKAIVRQSLGQPRQ